MEKVSAPAEVEARPRFLLQLDHDDIYFGCEPIAEGIAVDEREVVLDHAPDNPPGQYKWLRDQKRLDPLPNTQQKTEPGAPSLEQAFYDFVKNGTLGARAKAWCDWFEKTIEGRPSKGSES